MEINKELNGFPYHPYLNVNMDIMNNKELTPIQLRIIKEGLESKKKISDNILSSGLIIDEEYDIFVDPKYGAFFYNTPCTSMQEEIESCKDLLIMNYHTYVPQDELLSYIERGYEFIIGPSVKVFDDDNSLNGVYCINYKKGLVNKR